MANRCYFMSWDAAGGTLESPTLLSSNAVPIFWLAMFDAEDVHDATIDEEAFVLPPPIPQYAPAKTYLLGHGALALKRLKARLPVLIDLVGHDKLAGRFVRYAKRYAGATLVLNLDEVGARHDAGHYAAQLKSALASFDEPTPSRAALLRLTGLEPAWESDANADAMLIGTGTNLTALEVEKTKQKKLKAKRAQVDEVKKTEWQVAIDRCSPSMRKPYAQGLGFRANDIIDHTLFGPGLVIQAPDRKKIKVLFADGVRTLVQRR